MKIGISQLREIIMEEARALNEGCGGDMVEDDPCPACAAGEVCPCDTHDDHSELSAFKTDDDMLGKEEAIGAVVSIAQNTSCPATRQALLDAVSDLESSSHSGDEEMEGSISHADSDLEPMQGKIENMSPERAFAIGFIMGKSGDFDHMIDNRDYDQDEDYTVEDTGG